MGWSYIFRPVEAISDSFKSIDFYYRNEKSPISVQPIKSWHANVSADANDSSEMSLAAMKRQLCLELIQNNKNDILFFKKSSEWTENPGN